MPEAPVHDQVAERLKLLLSAWAEQQPIETRIARNLALRFYEQDPRIGIDPDLCVLAPPPDDLDELGSVCLWKAGHTAPSLCIEIVSTNHPNKDYAAIQDRYAALGTQELVVFDPMLAGPMSPGGPVALQLWRRDAEGAFTRSSFGDEPVYSQVLQAWFIATGRSIQLTDDRAGTRRWLTESERRREETSRAEARAEDAEARAKDAEARAGQASAEAAGERARADALERELLKLKSAAPKR